MRAFTVFLLILAPAMACAEVTATQEATRWLDSYESYRSNIKNLDQDGRTKCERQLYDILKTIDASRTCSNTSECTLVREKPFGPVVPVRVDASSALLEHMKAFRESCNDESVQSHYNTDLQHEPVCWKNVCMVKSQRK